MTVRETAPRLTIDNVGAGSWSDGFAEDVRVGLEASPKRLAPRHLYDGIGSALYEAITLLPEYYLTRAEMEILERDAGKILERVGEVEIVELGPGDGRKSRIVLEAALRRQTHVRYNPIDISATSLRALAERLVVEYDRLTVAAQCGDYVRALQSRSLRGPMRKLVLFLGSSIGNYERADAIALLRTISTALKSGDALLLGVDLKKSREALELAYDDPAGVTAAFNRNILARINRELGGAFDLRTFRFFVRYDEKRASVDSFQQSVREQRVRIAALDLEVPFVEGECILTESSYKYERADVQRMAEESGFRVGADWTDSAGRFSVNLLTVI
ncbi:MAG TPA: L-histidine N(alpha)-methyltransferase [Candidatus Tyrphobacter sp.]